MANIQIMHISFAIPCFSLLLPHLLAFSLFCIQTSGYPSKTYNSTTLDDTGGESDATISPTLQYRTELRSLPLPPVLEITRGFDILSDLPSSPLVLTGLLPLKQIQNLSLVSSLEQMLAELEKEDDGLNIPVDLAPHLPHSPPRNQGAQVNADGNLATTQSAAHQKMILPNMPSPTVILSPAKISFRPSQVFAILRMGRSARAANDKSGDPSHRRSSYYAYVRTWNILSHLYISGGNSSSRSKRIKEALLSTLPLQRLLSLFYSADPSPIHPPKIVRSINVWIGDGDVITPIHYDGLDNILFQLTGTKSLLLLPPSCVKDLGYKTRTEEEWVYEVGTTTLVKWSRRKTEQRVENHASFNPFTQSDGSGGSLESDMGNNDGMDNKEDFKKLVQRWVYQGAKLITLQPGQALFLPEFWSHAVVSDVENGNKGNSNNQRLADEYNTASSHNLPNDQDINIAINVWFVRA